MGRPHPLRRGSTLGLTRSLPQPHRNLTPERVTSPLFFYWHLLHDKRQRYVALFIQQPLLRWVSTMMPRKSGQGRGRFRAPVFRRVPGRLIGRILQAATLTGDEASRRQEAPFPSNFTTFCRTQRSRRTDTIVQSDDGRGPSIRSQACALVVPIRVEWIRGICRTSIPLQVWSSVWLGIPGRFAGHGLSNTWLWQR